MIAEESELKALFVAGLAGDAGAHRAFLEKASARLRGFFLRRLGGAVAEAEDLVQETVIALHVKRHTYDPAFPVTAWMYAIARYRLIDAHRRRKRAGLQVPAEEAEGLADHAEAEPGDPQRDVARLLDTLPAKQRDAIRLVKLEELSVKEAAARMSISESDVKVSIHRGLKALAKAFGRDKA